LNTKLDETKKSIIAVSTEDVSVSNTSVSDVSNTSVNNTSNVSSVEELNKVVNELTSKKESIE
jgi:hypothetical protein